MQDAHGLHEYYQPANLAMQGLVFSLTAADSRQTNWMLINTQADAWGRATCHCEELSGLLWMVGVSHLNMNMLLKSTPADNAFLLLGDSMHQFVFVLGGLKPFLDARLWIGGAPLQEG